MPRKYTPEEAVAAFWAKVDQSGGPDACWTWTAHRKARGYGAFKHHGHMWKSHRFAYTLAVGPIPDGIFVCHRCDNPPCCNPAHLWLGTSADNAADRESKGRGNQPRGDQNGSRLHPERLVRGEHVNHAKLTEAQVLAIRERAAGGELPCAIARAFGVSSTTIRDVVRRVCWAHVN